MRFQKKLRLDDKNGIRDKIRKLIILFILSFTIITLSAESLCVEAIKFRYLQSIYSDSKGVGLKHPEGVACNGKSLILVGDTGNDRLIQYSFVERSLKDVKELKIPQLSNPIRVQISSNGEFFALDGKKRRILRISSEGGFKGYLASQGLPSPSMFVPRSFKIDINNNIYILDILAGRVLILDYEGRYQRQIPLPSDCGFVSDLSIDQRGNIFLIDCIKNVVYLAKKGSDNFSNLTSNLKEYLNFPTSISVDKQGLIYIVDEYGGGIAIFGENGSFIGRQLSMGWNEGLLYYPSQICINEKKEVFIADKGNNRVQIFTLFK